MTREDAERLADRIGAHWGQQFSNAVFEHWVSMLCRVEDGAAGTVYARNGVVTGRPMLVPLTVEKGSGLWRTPRAGEMEGNGKNSVMHGGLQLKGQAKMWATPRARNPPRSSAQGTAGPTLTEQAVGRDPATPKMWPTPRASDGTRGSDAPHGDGGPSLKTKVMHTDGRPDPRTPSDGQNGSRRADLNPQFVAMLMGIPPDWLTLFTSEVTDLSPNALPKHGHN